MDKAEQTAFVEAYARCVASAPSDYVERFVRLCAEGGEPSYDEHYTSVMDALCIWSSATAYQMQQVD